ncbi:regulatory protein [Streptomyces sparsogenes DSM 40356]|uniref:Regulatory protein n=1 Tax=Streptomyces sparsogenes DSM 40356 TaxID=1331668 RepID=A0A1R1S5M6_9ACTN|nr:regulatory protein [Streptomyces sparsogenes DSM 40356]
MPSAVGAPAYTHVFPREVESAALARQLVRTVLETWHLPQLVDDAMHVVSELVANAVDHARGGHIRFTVTRTDDRRVRLAVVDKSHAEPVLRTVSPSEEHGRGLVIVDALSLKWGIDPLPWGKRTWADLELEGAR